MDLIDYMQTLAIFTVAVVGYILIFQRSGHTRNGHYTIPNWNFFIKKLWVRRQLRKRSRNVFEYLLDFQCFFTENISILQNENSFDSQMIFGCDQEGNSLLIKLLKRQDNTADVWLILRLQDGRVFTLPDHPRTSIVINTDKFEAAGLTIENLVHYKTWRVSFTGLLRANIRNKWTANNNDKELQFVKFNFIWQAAANPHHWPNDWSLKLRAAAIATEPWRNGQWINYLPTPTFGGYDQFGALFGRVLIENSEEQNAEISNMEQIELNLPGLRQRRCLPYEREILRRTALIVGVCKDGSVYIIGADSFEENLSQAQFGYVRTPKGKSFAIDWIDFQLANVAETPNDVPKATTVRFSANKKMYTTTIYFLRKHHVPLMGSRPFMWNTNIVPVELSLNGGRGFGVAILWYTNYPKKKISLSNELRLKRKFATKGKPNKIKLAFNVEDKEARNVLNSGCIGADLALLSAFIDKKSVLNHYNVPNCFILSVAALEMQINRNSYLLDSIYNIKKIAYGITEGNLKDACKRTVEDIRTCTLEPEIIQTITDFCHKIIKYIQIIELSSDESLIQDFPVKFTARPSNTEEHLSNVPLDAENKKLVGLSNLDEILNEIKECWASLYTYESVEHRRIHVQPICSQMAVVIQMIVPYECSGVLFTRHKISGDPSKIIISANFGIEKSFTGLGHDVYTVKRNYKGDNVELVHIKQGNAIFEKSTVKESQNTFCLTEAQVLQLSKIGIELEKMDGRAREIEWVFFENNFYLLQSCSIEKLNDFSDWELLHEFDSPIMSTDDLSTFSTIGITLPNCLTPLTYSTVYKHFNKHMMTKYDPYRGLFSKMLLYSHHRSSMNVYNVFLKLAKKDLTPSLKFFTSAISGFNFLTPEMNKIAVHRNGVKNIFSIIPHYLNILGKILTCRSKVKSSQRFMDRFVHRFSSHNLKEYEHQNAWLFNSEVFFIVDDEDYMDEIVKVHIQASEVCAYYQMLAIHILLEGDFDITSEKYMEIALMFGSCTDTETLEIPKLIESISDDIYLDGKSREFTEINPKDGLLWLKQHCRSASRSVKEFIEKHGHRAVNELDLATETWSMKTEVVIEMIQAASKRANNALLSHKHNRRELSNSEIIEMLKTPKKKSTKFLLSIVLPLVKNSFYRREKTKNNIVAFIHELRKGYRHLATLMYGEGLLPDKDLIFYMTMDEIKTILTEQAPNAPPIQKDKIIQKAIRRKNMFPTWNTYRFHEGNYGLLKPIKDDDEVPLDSNTTQQVTGIPICEGIVTGRACVLANISDKSKVRNGDILITHSIDIGWSPYFPILGGVVTEHGGLISHGAVIARAYGIPCIIGAFDATSIFQHGDTIIMNATNGIVLKITKNK